MIENFRSRCVVPVSMVDKDMEYLWDAIDRVVADARRALLGNELVGGLTIHVHRRPNLARPSYGVELNCTVDRGRPR